MVAIKVMVAVMATVRMEELSDLKKTSNVEADQLQSDSRSAVVDAVVYGYYAITLSPHKFLGRPGSSWILLMNEALYELKYSYIENMRIWNVKGGTFEAEVAELGQGICLKNKPGFNPLHITASEGHQGILVAATGAAREVN
nr:pyridoxal phosphate-dependent transferase [Tanacetum cinerariifolium]